MRNENIRCFFITPIGDKGSDIRRHADEMLELIEYALSRLSNYKFTVIRSDKTINGDTIDNQMHQDIFSSELCVADVSGFNPNVMYEVGYRRGAKKNIIIICKKGEKLPFDIAHQTVLDYDYADYESRQQLKADLARHVEELLKREPIVEAGDVPFVLTPPIIANIVKRSLNEYFQGNGNIMNLSEDIRRTAD